MKVLPILMCFLAMPAMANDKPIVAVFDVEDRGAGLEAPVLKILSDYLNARMAAVGFQVIPRSDILERLREQKKESFKECYDQKCQIELGRELAAQLSLSTQVIKVGQTCQVAAVLYDLKKATAVQAVTQEAACKDHELLQAVKRVVDELGKQLESKEVSKVIEDVLLGTMLVHTEPSGAEVFIDGEASGTTPFTTRLKAGSYEIRVAKEGHLPAKKTARLEVGKKTKVVIPLTPLEQGTLSVNTEPAGARVALDGREVGASPLELNLKAGNYLLSISKEGFCDLEQEVILDWTRQTRTDLKLAAIPSYDTWGHISFWSGIGVAAFGVVATYMSVDSASAFEADGDRSMIGTSRTWAGVMWSCVGISGSLIITGIVLWLLTPDSSKTTAPPAEPAGR